MKRTKTRKVRKRTNSKVPAKGRLRDMADQLWSLIVRARWNNRCAVCGYRDCEAHHMVPRGHESTRYELLNGIALCSTHHQFDNDVSPHQNAAGWLAWLESQHPKVAEWYIANKIPPRFEGTKNAWYYMDLLRSFRPHVEAKVFEGIVGVKFSLYLEQL